MKHNYIPALLVLFALASCSTLKPENFESSLSVLDPVKFFVGHTHSAGVLEAHNGKPSERITTKTSGVFANGVLTIQQDINQEKEKPGHRFFNLNMIDKHQVGRYR